MSARDRHRTMSAELRDRVLAEAKRTPSPTRQQQLTRTALVVGGGALSTAAFFFAKGGVVRGARPIELVVFAAGTGILGALALTRISSRGGSMLGRPRRVLLLGSAVVAALLVAAAFVAAALWPAHAAETVRPAVHVGCAILAMAQGALPLVALLLLRKGSDPVHPAFTGAALGLTAGAWSAAMAYLRCPHSGTFHCIVAHVVLPMLVLAAVAASLGRALVKVR